MGLPSGDPFIGPSPLERSDHEVDEPADRLSSKVPPPPLASIRRPLRGTPHERETDPSKCSSRGLAEGMIRGLFEGLAGGEPGAGSDASERADRRSPQLSFPTSSEGMTGGDSRPHPGAPSGSFPPPDRASDRPSSASSTCPFPGWISPLDSPPIDHDPAARFRGPARRVAADRRPPHSIRSGTSER